MDSQVQQLFDLACMLSESDRRDLVNALLANLPPTASEKSPANKVPRPLSESAKIPWEKVEQRIEE